MKTKIPGSKTSTPKSTVSTKVVPGKVMAHDKDNQTKNLTVMKSSKGSSSGKTPSKATSKSSVKSSAKMHVIKGNGAVSSTQKGASAGKALAVAKNAQNKVTVLPSSLKAGSAKGAAQNKDTPVVALKDKKAATTVAKSSLAERLVAARGVKAQPPKAPVAVAPSAPKVNLKLVAKGVARVAVSKITRSEPTSPHIHREPQISKVISAKFGGESVLAAAPSRPVAEINGAQADSVEDVSFKTGDKIVYPGHGVGEIEGVRVTNLGGEVHHIYNIKILESGMKVMVPLSQARSVGLRKIIDKRAIDQVYEILRDRAFKIDTQTWNRRFREYSQKIKTGSVYEIAIVLRDLLVLSADKELSFGEKKMLDMAESLLVSEIAIAKARPHDKIVGELRSLFA